MSPIDGWVAPILKYFPTGSFLGFKMKLEMESKSYTEGATATNIVCLEVFFMMKNETM